MDFLVVIPARFKSSRLPGKPLLLIDGLPMIVRTYRQCLAVVPADRILVATDDSRIIEVCEREGIRTAMTSELCLTGTDRIAEVAIGHSVATYINVQGDEPVLNPSDLSAIIEASYQHPGDVINGYCKIQDEKQFRSRSIPKVVMRNDGRLLYASRSGIPTTKEHGFVDAWRQVGIYAYPAAALQAFRAPGRKTQLEEFEDIEILRFLELGFEVRMIPLSSKSISVDEAADIGRVEGYLRSGIKNSHI